MPYFPTVKQTDTSRSVIDAFKGYNHNLRIGAGEFYDMKNLCSTEYPLLANRKKRGTVHELTTPQGIIAKDALAYIDNGTLYYNGYATGLTGLQSGEKQLVSMGAFLCIFPDKKYFNTIDMTDFGDMEAHYTAQAATYTISTDNGEGYATPTVSASEPEEPENLDLWIDTSGDKHILKQYSSITNEWVSIVSVYTKITFTSQGTIPELFSQFDGVKISGCEVAEEDSGLYAQVKELNGDKIIYALGGSEEDNINDYIVVIGLLDQSYTQEGEGTQIKISRELPQMDYVCEAQNRLWGCFYGNVDGKNLNEIYCSALGDFKNWSRYLGISTDSWTASVGSDGQWTGAINYLGNPTFFKEDRVHQVEISAIGAHSVNEMPCRGVQKGSSKSLVLVNETLYYKSKTDVCAYQGGFPAGISEALGDKKYFDAVGGSYGEKYYISMKDASGAWTMFVYDINKGLWHKEDATHALAFAATSNELFYIDADSNTIIAANGAEGTLEAEVEWAAVTGIMYYAYPDHKYVSRYNIRLKMEERARLNVYIRYDSDGEWEYNGTIEFAGTNTMTLPIRPRRCDHLQIKLEGKGNVKIYSIASILELGSDI